MVPQPIPYQGSKRAIADFILGFFPPEVNCLVEPFAGSAAVSVAAAIQNKAHCFHLNDINAPLMALWQAFLDQPDYIASRYDELWHEQLGQEKEFYNLVRTQFNQTQKPEYLLYLLARCVKAAVRYNSNGDFSQSADNRRKGRQPHKMRADIIEVSRLFAGRTRITCLDYQEVLKSVSPDDLVYMDPPYRGVCTGRDPRYFQGLDHDDFVRVLARLVERGISFILSYDGRRGSKTYGDHIPEEIGVIRHEVKAGRSSQATLLGRDDVTYESVYVSQPLQERLNLDSGKELRQASLFP